MPFLIVLLSFTYGYAGSPLLFESFSLQGLVLFWGLRLGSCSMACGIFPDQGSNLYSGKSPVFLLDELILD